MLKSKIMLEEELTLTLRKHLRYHRNYKRVFSTISTKMRNVKFMSIITKVMHSINDVPLEGH